MNIIELNSKLSISDQIKLEDVAQLAKLGVKLIICNRPDNEEADQISYREVKKAASQHGIDFEFIPVAGREIPLETLEKFVECTESRTDRIHAYCRTGTRCSIFWGLSEARHRTPKEVLSTAESKGLNLSPVVDQLEKIHDL